MTRPRSNPGSPPLVRERRGADLKQRGTVGITPARAGKTRHPHPGALSGRDHPRSCGKDAEAASRNRFSGRITPARAGKTFGLDNLKAETRDHPRSCGKDESLHFTIDGAEGSPPLVRERQFFHRAHAEGLGITPARAGKTHRSLCVKRASRDHPRSCGKDGQDTVTSMRLQGSPPLVRERLNDGKGGIKPVRITPARAGKTGHAERESNQLWDHPRSCGKDVEELSGKSQDTGSPPLVRERPAASAASDLSAGITPARAGKTNPFSA